MFTTEFEIVLAIACFFLGAFEGQNILAWVKSWFVKEVAAVESKVTGTSGPTGGH
jgi:hypothetical protein